MKIVEWRDIRVASWVLIFTSVWGLLIAFAADVPRFAVVCLGQIGFALIGLKLADEGAKGNLRVGGH